MSRGARMARAGARIVFTSVERLTEMQAAQDRSAVQLIERGAVAAHVDGADWLDTRPMVDLREVRPETADEAQEALQYAAQRGLLVVHARQQHLVRVIRRPL